MKNLVISMIALSLIATAFSASAKPVEPTESNCGIDIISLNAYTHDFAFSNNTISDNRGEGIYISNEFGSEVEHFTFMLNKITGNTGYGLEIYNFDSGVHDFNFIGNTITGNGMLEPIKVEVIDGRAEVRAIFSAIKRAKAAGVYVTEGKLSRGASVRVRRDGEIVAESTIGSLRRFQDDVKEVSAGYECGVVLQDFGEYKVGDVLDLYRVEEVI